MSVIPTAWIDFPLRRSPASLRIFSALATTSGLYFVDLES